MESLTFDMIRNTALVLMALWGFYKAIQGIAKAITDRHDKEQNWNKMSEKYDKVIEEVKQQIDDNQTDTDAKLQEVRAELLILTECMQAVLDGLHQLNCNGKVTEAREMLDEYLVKRAHD